MMRGLGLSMTLIFVTSCTSISNEKTVDSRCLVFKLIYFSAKDTEKTIDQILAHDAVYTELCQPHNKLDLPAQ